MEPRLARALLFVTPLALLAGGLLWWMARDTPVVVPDSLSNVALDQRLLTVEQTLTTLARGQSRNEQRLADLDARIRVQREELLGWGQRIALLDESLQQAASAPQVRPAVQLRLDEVDLLLSFAAARLTLAGDVDAARRAYALADGLLATLTDPQFVNLRQSLAQEQAALAALPPDPRFAAQATVDVFERELAALEWQPVLPPSPAATSSFDRLLNALVDVRPRGDLALLAPADRQRGDAALRLELSLARIAIEQRDEAGLAASAVRAQAWLRQLHTPGPALDAAIARLDELAGTRLAIAAPVFGSTLAQLRAQRRAEDSP